MSIMTKQGFNGGLKSVANNAAKVRDTVHELLITAVYYAERDGDVGSINRVLEAVGSGTRMWGIHKWIKLYAPVKLNEAGDGYVLDAKKRQLTNKATEADFVPFETVMRSEPKWYELAPTESAKSVWDAENAFETFIAKLKKSGKLTEAEQLEKVGLAILKHEVSSETADA